MCQYFWKPAGVTIDEEKLKNSVINNPHGWGMLYRNDPSNGKINPFKFLMCDDPKEDTDPDEIIYLVNNKFKDKDVYLHLRWVTAGDRSIDNIHPFSVLERGKKQLFLMHNGTLSEFKPKIDDSRSDTRIFTDTVMSPLAKTMRKPFKWDSWKEVSTLIHKLIGSWSRVMLISSAESVPLLFNYSKHHFEKDENGGHLWLASNSYSFNPDHRKPKTNTNYYSYSGYSSYYSTYEGRSSVNWYKDRIKVGDVFVDVKKTYAYSDEDISKAENDIPIGIYLAGADTLRNGEPLQDGIVRIIKDVIDKNIEMTAGSLVVDDVYVIADISKSRNSNNYLSSDRSVLVYM